MLKKGVMKIQIQMLGKKERKNPIPRIIQVPNKKEVKSDISFQLIKILLKPFLFK